MMTLSDCENALLSVDVTDDTPDPDDPGRRRLRIQARAVMHEPDGCRIEMTSPGTYRVDADTDDATKAAHARRELALLKGWLPDSDRISGKIRQIVSDLEGESEDENDGEKLYTLPDDTEDAHDTEDDHELDDLDDDDDWDWGTPDLETQLSRLRNELLADNLPTTRHIFDAIDALAANPNILWSRDADDGLRGSLTGSRPSMHSHLAPAAISRPDTAGDDYEPQPARWVGDGEPGCLGPIALLRRTGYPATLPTTERHADSINETTIEGIAAIHAAMTGKKGVRHGRLTKDAALWLMLEGAATGPNTDELILKLVDRTMMAAETLALLSAADAIHEYLYSRIDSHYAPCVHIAG